MADELKNTGAGNLFVVFGEPDIDIEPVGKDQVRVQVKGVDVFKPQTGEVVSAGPEGIACWFIDTDCVQRATEDETLQFVGVEFFGINHHVPHLLDVATLTLLFEMKVRKKEAESFLDFTNPEGEGLVLNSDSIIGYRLLMNDAEVMHDDVPHLYDSLRRREYCWPFYDNHCTTHQQIIEFLQTADTNHQQPLRT